MLNKLHPKDKEKQRKLLVMYNLKTTVNDEGILIHLKTSLQNTCKIQFLSTLGFKYKQIITTSLSKSGQNDLGGMMRLTKRVSNHFEDQKSYFLVPPKCKSLQKGSFSPALISPSTC